MEYMRLMSLAYKDLRNSGRVGLEEKRAFHAAVFGAGACKACWATACKKFENTLHKEMEKTVAKVSLPREDCSSTCMTLMCVCITCNLKPVVHLHSNPTIKNQVQVQKMRSLPRIPPGAISLHSAGHLPTMSREGEMFRSGVALHHDRVVIKLDTEWPSRLLFLGASYTSTGD